MNHIVFSKVCMLSPFLAVNSSQMDILAVSSAVNYILLQCCRREPLDEHCPRRLLFPSRRQGGLLRKN